MPVASLVRVTCFSSRRMATLATPMIPANPAAANRPTATSVIRAVMADLLLHGIRWVSFVN
jgi:hypothetical protein